MTTQVDLRKAFSVLAEAVGDYYDAGRRSYSAALKPELHKRTSGAFDERALGFENFRQFLAAAERGRFVDIQPATRGPDVELVPPGKSPHVDLRAPQRQRVARLRGDLWKAWVDWTPGYRRLYDRERDVAERIPAVPTDSLSGVTARAETRSAPQRLPP